MAETSAQSVAQSDEPAMYLQRPSSASSQDVSHVLARTFRHLFTRDKIPPETVHYLSTSKGGDDPYHESYVQRLQEINEQKERRIAEAAMLERHLMQAKARALAADEQAQNRLQANMQGFPDLVLPPAPSYLRSCLDFDLLRKHNLLSPSDFSQDLPPVAVPAPSAPPVPTYARDTVSTRCRNTDNDSTSPLMSLEEVSELHLDSETDSTLSTEHLPPPPPPAQSGGDERNLWKEQVLTEERVMHRADLANMQARVNYLKNPRHQHPTGSKMLLKANKTKAKEFCIKPEPQPQPPPSQVFLPSPPVIAFTNYQVGEVYEVTLELQNVSAVSHPVRVIPPATSFFSVSLGLFPGESGLVAPGMACHYKVRFIPDSLSDYDDVLTVQSQASSPLLIPIRARRPPPLLTVPSVVEAGQCLVGGVKMLPIKVVNEGGAGRFCLMPRAQWPPNNAKMAACRPTVHMPPFEVRPVLFELGPGQETTLELMFGAEEVKSYSQEMTLVCDNCQVKHITLTGEGRSVGVELGSVEGGLSELLPGEPSDLTAQGLLRMDTLNPFTYTQKTVAVRNLVDVEVPFKWLCVKPYISMSSDDVAVPSERVQDVDSAFSVEPCCGALQPSASLNFTITFAPPQVQAYHNALHLVLENIPSLPPPVTDQESGEGTPQAPPLHSEPRVSDMTVLELEVKGDCEALQVILQPYAAIIPGQILIETAVKQEIRMLNHSRSTVFYQWENLNSSTCVVQVEPPVGQLDAQCERDFELCVCGNEPGLIDHTLLCHIQHLPEPLTLSVQASIKGPEVKVEQPNVNFDLIRLGGVGERRVTLTNMSRVPAKWRLRETAEESSEFMFSATEGELAPLDSVEVGIKWTPSECTELSTIFIIDVERGNQVSLSVIGQVQQPQVCLLTCQVMLSGVYLNTPTCHDVHLANQTVLPTHFTWGEVEGEDCALCSVSMEPASGLLTPRSQLPIKLHFTPFSKGRLCGLRLPCQVEGMTQPLWLALSADVEGISVEYMGHSPTADGQTRTTRGEDTVLDFGQVRFSETPRCTLVIHNNTAIPAPFSLTVEKLFTKPPSPPDVAKPSRDVDGKSQRRNVLLGKTPNLADPLSKSASKFKSDVHKAMLYEGRGAAFSVSPASGYLQPFADQEVEVTGYSDLWGRYTDNLLCKVGDLETRCVPLVMEVKDNPLHFQMMATQPSQTPSLRFGSHVTGANVVRRQLRINNPSPADIRLDWQVFRVREDDEQLIDFVVTYGQVFPLKDRTGREIIQKPATTSVAPEGGAKQATPTSPDSSLDSSPDTSSMPSSPATPTHCPDTITREATDVKPNIMSVVMRPHVGDTEECPFTFQPTQTVIPARGHRSVEVTFTPWSDLPTEQHFTATAHGYMSLLPESVEVGGVVQRDHQYQVPPLTLNMTAHTKPATLSIECHDEEGMRYRAACSDLMADGQLQSECLKLCGATLHNATLTPLSFSLSTVPPFYLVELDRDLRLPVNHMTSTGAMVLKPSQSALVHVGFRISTDLLKHLEVATSDDCEAKVTVDDLAEGKKLHFRDQLSVTFNNNSQQTLPLHATLCVPRLSLSRDDVDFGVCFVGQERELQVVLTNVSSSHSYWKLVTEECCDVFRVTPTSGCLHTQTASLTDHQTLLHLYFTAKHCDEYRAVFTVQGSLGEPPLRLCLRGRGSYDGRHDCQVGV